MSRGGGGGGSDVKEKLIGRDLTLLPGFQVKDRCSLAKSIAAVPARQQEAHRHGAAQPLVKRIVQHFLVAKWPAAINPVKLY